MNRIWSFILSLSFAFILLLPGCGDDIRYDMGDSQGGSSSANQAGASATGGSVAILTTYCHPGEQQMCVMADGRSGLKFCSEDGGHFSECYASGTSTPTTQSTGGAASVGTTAVYATGGVSTHTTPATGGTTVYLSPATGGQSPQVTFRTGGTSSVVSCTDCDGDGESASSDCNDLNASIHHGAYDTCGDGIDQDCSGADTLCVNNDKDGDGYAATSVNGSAADCNDNNAAIHPGAAEICGDGIDQDCSGADALCNTSTVDQDGDGESASSDCNDLNASIHHGAYDICGDGIDQDCSGGDVLCASTNNGNVACANMTGISSWRTLTIVVTTNETSRVQFLGMCDNGETWSAFTVIPGCESITSSNGTFTCRTQIPAGWTFEGNNNLNNGYWSVGILTGDAARSKCSSSFNSSTNTCSNIWSATNAHGTYTVNGIACQVSSNWVENGDDTSFNCRVTP